MAWVYLFVAGLLEVVWAVAMKESQGLTRPAPTLTMIVAMIASLGLLALAMRSLPLGTAYMVWTGIGAVGAFLIGIWFLGEGLTMLRAIAAGFIVIGLILMKLAH